MCLKENHFKEFIKMNKVNNFSSFFINLTMGKLRDDKVDKNKAKVGKAKLQKAVLEKLQSWNLEMF